MQQQQVHTETAGNEAKLQEMLMKLRTFSDLVQDFSLFSSSSESSCKLQIGENGSVYCNCEGCVRWHAFVEGNNGLFDGQVKYEVFNQDHVSVLAHYLQDRAATYKLSDMKVLEVGAGSGHLSYYLNLFLAHFPSSPEEPIVTITVMATDNGLRGLNGPCVRKQDASDAIREEKPDIVICSWMPMGVDWTAQMRAMFSIREYILIGEIDGGICGHPWLTWGYSSEEDSSDDTDTEADDNHARSGSKRNQFSSTHYCASNDRPETAEEDKDCHQHHPEFLPVKCQRISTSILEPHSSNSQGNGLEEQVKENPLASVQECLRAREANHDVTKQQLYKIEGFERVELESMSTVQICRTDERWLTTRHSHTVSFRRLQKNILSVNMNT
jgi:hypothetical protein